jgi:hypothetical protein
VNNSPVRFIDPSGHCTGNQRDSIDQGLSCWGWIDKITQTYKNIHIDPEAWTSVELKAAWYSLQDHPFRPEIMGAKSITLYRMDYYHDKSGGYTAGATYRRQDINGNYLDEYDIYIFNDAYIASPTGNGKTTPSIINFQGTIAHEFTHVAVNHEPSLRDSYISAKGLRPTIHGDINWALSTDQIGESIAIAAATWEIDPDLLIDEYVFGLFPDPWLRDWIAPYAARTVYYESY